MKEKRRLIPVIVLVVLVVLIGGYFIGRAVLNTGSQALSASGTIESINVTISPEIGGKVAEVNVDEGTAVKTGDVLFSLDDTLLQAQRSVSAATLDSANAAALTADAGLASAQAQYNLALDAARTEAVASRTASWRADNPSGYTLPGWYFGQDEAIAASQAEADAAASARDAAGFKLDALLKDSNSADFVAAEKRLIEARAAFLVTQDVLNRANAASNNADLQSSAQTAYDTAQTELTDAQKNYDKINDTDAAKNILRARADLAVAQERADSAQDRLLALQTGEASPKVAAAQAAFHQAQTAADQAHLAVAQAQTALALLDAQLAKLRVRAPVDGMILTRSIEPGEVVPAGATALSIGELDSLTITVYIPEDRYGEINLGQNASVSVDSFPGQTFTAKVVHIADQAEFTPRNVQTVSGRKSTVFAIKLQLDASSGKLKPGMPADVNFAQAAR
jgi:HlyD family secretion protein